MDPARQASSRERAASDLVGTLLLLVLVVGLASLIAVIVTTTLQAPAAPAASFALASAAANDTNASLLYRNGPPLALAELRVEYARGAGASTALAPGALVTRSPTTLVAGDRVRFALSPPLASGERLTVRVFWTAGNALLAESSTSAGVAAGALAVPTLTLSLSPATLPNDSVTTALLVARASAPQGALTIASVSADASAIGSSTLALNDAGRDGDRAGADGAWSAVLRVPTTTQPGAYAIAVRATDASGFLAASGNVTLTVVASPGSTVSSFLNGSCYNCTPIGGNRVIEGTRFRVPSSANISQLYAENFIYDKLNPTRLGADAVVIRITDGNRSWSARFTLSYGDTNNVPAVSTLIVWDDAGLTNFLPRNGTGVGVPLAGIHFDFLHPVASLQWTVSSGAAESVSSYKNAGIVDPATLIVAYIRDETITGQTTPSQNVGVYAFDLVAQ